MACGYDIGEDIGQSSTFRGLKTIYFLLLSYVAQLKHKRVKIFADNQGAAKIVAIGSSKINLQALAMDIFNLFLVDSIILEAQWIPRSLTERADLLSRFVDKDDWSVNPSVFRVTDAKWGPHTIDRFASHCNAQVPMFNSKFSSLGCSRVDALAQDWLDENNWVCPPVSAIVPFVRALSSCSGYGTLIVPQWPSAYFWPFLHGSSSQFRSSVKVVFELPCIEDLLLESSGQRQIYKARPLVFRGYPRFRMLALRVYFR